MITAPRSLSLRRATRARVALGMPRRHPENPVRRLRRRHERWLASVSAVLWPAAEYTQIVAEDWRGRNAT